MMPNRKTLFLLNLTIVLMTAGSGIADSGALPDNDILMKAMVDELTRSMKDLVLGDLSRPYFMQYNADDRVTVTINAAYGGLLQSTERRSRGVGSRVRVGSYVLDNSNVGRGGGARGGLPLDDDYTALRHSTWRLTDEEYKRAVETLVRKESYLKDKTIEDRPDDFTPAEPVVVIEPSADMPINREKWEDQIKLLSARFEQYPAVRNAAVGFIAGAINEFIVNSEGTRLRTADTGALLKLNAEIQADDGMMLTDSLTYIAERVEQLPTLEEMIADIDVMCGKLIALAKAPVLEQYAGPVLLDPLAAGAVFEVLLGDELCARPAPLGAGGSAQEESLEKRLGQRILPRSFQVYDDPRETQYEGNVLAGTYVYDDEAVPATRVNLVENGVLKALLASRSPTKKIKHSTGHARGGEFGDPRASIGCLYLADDLGMDAAALKKELLQAAREEGLEYGLRVSLMEQGSGQRLGSPIYTFKVYVADGHEELVRGLEFLPVQTRALKRIIAAGNQRKVYNITSPISASVITPAVLFEELELRKLEEEFDKPPILKSPATREDVAVRSSHP